MKDLASVDRKIEWADRLIENLGAEIQAFLEDNSYKIVPRPKPGEPEKIQYLFLDPKPLPIEISLRVGDVAHNLRTALDHLACLGVVRGNGNVSDDTAFPVWRKNRTPTGSEYKGPVRGKVNGASQDVIDLLKGLEPYFGGADQPLRVVDYLDIVDKHRELVVAFFRGGVFIRPFGGMREELGIPDTFGVEIFAKGPEGTPAQSLKHGDVIYETSKDHTDHLPTVAVALGEPWVIQGEAVIKALTQLALFVKGTIDKFRPLL